MAFHSSLEIQYIIHCAFYLTYSLPHRFHLVAAGC